jgi:predicted nucleic acid-binding protein
VAIGFFWTPTSHSICWGGDETVASILDGRELYISVISEMELLGYPGISAAEATKIKGFIADIEVLELSAPIKEKTIFLRQSWALKLPDAIIAATALQHHLPFFSADSVFKKIPDLYFVHYAVG